MGGGYVVAPYSLAYIDAYAKFKDVLEAQDEYDKKQAEFSAFALSLIGGSVLTMVFRKSSLSYAIKESSIEAMFKANSETLLIKGVRLD